MSALQIIILTLAAECALVIWAVWKDGAPTSIDDRLSAADDEIRNRPRLG